MELKQEAKGYSDKEEDEEEEENIIREESKLSFSSSISSLLSSSSSSSTNYKFKTFTDIPKSNNNSSSGLLGMIPGYSPKPTTSPTTKSFYNSFGSLGLPQIQDSATNFNRNNHLEFMDLSLGSSGSGTDLTNTTTPVEKEHMFDKVVTPSDVGKLNRLVIPKQHAEKYFPLDSSTNERGLVLNFDDRTGKSWRFRYSYWNSSQSYVMTKGWSRFVKEKKLDAGDIVSFQRGVGESYKHRLYIDWKRRSDQHSSTDPNSMLIQNQHQYLSQYNSMRWGARLYSLPHSPSSYVNYNIHQHQQYHQYPFHHHDHHYNQYEVNSGSGSVFNYRNNLTMAQQQEGSSTGCGEAPIVFESVPIGHHHHATKTTATSKRLRLFGVNMEYYSPEEEEEEPEAQCCILPSTIASTTPQVTHGTVLHNSVVSPLLPSSSLQLRLPHSAPMSSFNPARFQDKGETSMQYFQ